MKHATLETSLRFFLFKLLINFLKQQHFCLDSKLFSIVKKRRTRNESVCVCCNRKQERHSLESISNLRKPSASCDEEEEEKEKRNKKRSKSILAVRDTRFTTYSNAHTNTQTLCSRQLTGVRDGRSFYTEYKYTMSELAEVLVFPLL